MYHMYCVLRRSLLAIIGYIIYHGKSLPKKEIALVIADLSAVNVKSHPLPPGHQPCRKEKSALNIIILVIIMIFLVM